MAGKFYAVKKGKVPGIYTSWDACKSMVHGFPGAVYKGFATRAEAEQFLGEKKEELQRCYSVTSDPTSKRSENTHMLTNFAEQQTDKTNKLSRDIGLIEQTAQEAVGGLYPFILKNVTEISRMNIWEYHVDDASFILCEENFSVYWTRRKGNCKDLFGY